jgi:hypothetical protein
MLNGPRTILRFLEIQLCGDRFLQTAQFTLARDDANEWSRATFLRLLLHVAGDVHQPLHCNIINLISLNLVNYK